MKILLIPVLIIAALWDGASSVIGAIGILGSDVAEMAAGVLLTITVMSMLLSTRRIIGMREGFVGKVLTGTWVIALVYDFYTSWMGNSQYLLHETKPSALFLVLGLTILCVAAPILLSAFLMRPRKTVESGSLSEANQSA
ncbi:MAG: hypothetical protein P1U89_12345 [Verrucomicrobiales bacterium]|nr:hypothetical protein [Verrucomicrobiales bacterium]